MMRRHRDTKKSELIVLLSNLTTPGRTPAPRLPSSDKCAVVYLVPNDAASARNESTGPRDKVCSSDEIGKSRRVSLFSLSGCRQILVDSVFFLVDTVHPDRLHVTENTDNNLEEKLMDRREGRRVLHRQAVLLSCPVKPLGWHDVD